MTSRDSSTNWKGRRRCPNDPDLRHPMSGPGATPVLGGRPRLGWRQCRDALQGWFEVERAPCHPGDPERALSWRRPGKPAVIPDRRHSVPARPPRGCGLPGYTARPAPSVRRPPGLDRMTSRRLMGRSPSALGQFRGPRFTATIISPAVEPRPRPGIPGLASRRHHDYAELSVQSTRCRTSTAKIDHDQALVLVNRR
jgi:hypothetical protein